MDIDQIARTLNQLEGERQQDQKRIAELTARLDTLAGENAVLNQRLKELEGETTKALSMAARAGSNEAMLSQVRADVNKQIEILETRRAESERELERLRRVEREGLNRLLGDMKKQLDAVTRLEQEVAVRKEEERRLQKAMNDMQIKVADVVRRDKERLRGVAAVEEGRRLDAKRVADLQAELTEFRKRVEDNRSRLETLEDLIRRNDARLGEMLSLENDRRLQQMAWIENQAVLSAERDRAWNDLKQDAAKVIRDHEDFARRMETYGETYRQMRQAIDDYHSNVERIERRINEAAEIQRLAEERFRQEWNAFLADEQKRWTTHMLLRDEQWREHDRQAAKLLDRVIAVEESSADLSEAVHTMQAMDHNRLQSLFKLIREGLAEYDQSMTKVR